MILFTTLALSLLQIWGNWISPIPSNASLYFAGDAMQHIAQIESAHQADGSYSYSNCFTLVKEQISEANLAICNLEVTLGGKPYRGYPQFSAPDEFAIALKDAGFDIMLTANNHCLDRGSKGLIRTLDILDSLGIAHVGTYRNQEERDSLYPYITTTNGIRCAILNYTYGTNGISVNPPCIVNYIDTTQILKDINKARIKKADVIIACMHWGNEYVYKPSEQQRYLAQLFVDNGADLIIGTHPHVLQPLEYISKPDGSQVPCFYSLGNFTSSQTETPRMLGGMAKVTITKTEGENTVIETAIIQPTVTHISSDCRYYTTYMLSNYTNELASSHYLTRKGKNMTVEKLNELYNSICTNN